MADRPYVTDLRLTTRAHSYRLRLRFAEGWETEMRTDGNLGSIMSAWSVALRSYNLEARGVEPKAPVRFQNGPVDLTTYRIERATVAPLAWRLVMGVGGWTYEALMDRDLESVISAYAGAMKFFGVKTGVLTLWSDVVRNTERAHEEGFLQ